MLKVEHQLLQQHQDALDLAIQNDILSAQLFQKEIQVHHLQSLLQEATSADCMPSSEYHSPKTHGYRCLIGLLALAILARRGAGLKES